MPVSLRFDLKEAFVIPRRALTVAKPSIIMLDFDVVLDTPVMGPHVILLL